MTAQIGRFIVRDVNIFDAAELLSLFGDGETVRYLGLRRLRSIEDAYDLIARYRTSQSRWLTVHEGPKFLGVVGLEVKGHQATMTIASNGTRRGFGREFGKPFVQWIFTHPQIWRMWSYVHVDNIAGQRVTERSGAIKEGRLRRFEFFPNISDEPQDVYVYAIVRD
jgi:RimJ/RimL family protein N-acetyltransferase